MLYKHDTGIVKILKGIKRGLDENFDCVMVIVGDTGTGKSMFGLHLIEAWLKLNGKEVTKKDINCVHVEKMKWLETYRNLGRHDINVFDEGAAGLGAKQYQETFSKTLEMLFQVVRQRGIFTIVIAPNFFRLSKYFREDRLRVLVDVNKRGHYKVYTRRQIIKICQLNERKILKNMNVVQPLHNKNFPDYDGILKEPYNKMKDVGVSEILEEVIEMNKPKEKKVSMIDAKRDSVLKLYSKGKTQREIAKKLNCGVATVNRCLADL